MSNELIHPDPSNMTPDEHIAEAGRLLAITGMGKVDQALNRAQVHATLAVAKRLHGDGGTAHDGSDVGPSS